MELKSAFAVVKKSPGSEPRLIDGTCKSTHELCCTEYDGVKFSSPPEDCVYLVKIHFCDVIESSSGTAN